ELNSNHGGEFHLYIAYDIKNGVEYAKLVKSTRHGQKVSKEYKNLGRVMDKENNIFKSRELGIYQYDIANDYYDKNPNWSGSTSPVEYPERKPDRREHLILDFGDTYLIDSFIHNNGLDKIINKCGVHNKDTLYSMICYYILSNTANCHAKTWWEGNFARMRYPSASLESQRISEFLSELGSEESYRSFFRAYAPYISDTVDGDNILIDSTGLPNNIHFPLTAISNHNGNISNEVRLIYVTQQSTGLPIYFRYCPGNVIDVTTLTRTIHELKNHGVNTKFSILDAGYYTADNIRTLYHNKISFVSRIPEKMSLYKELVAEHLDTIESKENLIRYNGRFIYIKRVECNVVDDFKGYAYIGLDISRKEDEDKKLFQKADDQKLTNDEVFDKIKHHGLFVIVSSRPMATDKILPTYYTRQQIEQIFDIGKNYADMLPLRVQNEDTFRGHLLLTFISCVILKMMQDKLKSTKYNPISMFMNLRNQKCKVYATELLTTEATKAMNDCYKLFKITCPAEVSLQRG
ncbi:transposase, partial [Ruminococcus sp.]|uniref:transposase n=1 Tax=Ruminococcus sp. TaxID=41978 RepID=UPI00258D30A4